MINNKIKEAAKILKNSQFAVAFTGAGISVESGIPPFRGEGGLWEKLDPKVLDLDYFYENPKASWELFKSLYESLQKAKPNPAHIALAELEKSNIIKLVITQNIDNLHFYAGNKKVVEFHGNTREATCVKCGKKYKVSSEIFNNLPPKCSKCGGILKPDFVYFGEGIPQKALEDSYNATMVGDVFILIGTSGVIQPAASIPFLAKQNGAKIIEVNLDPSTYTNTITDIFLQGKAGEILPKLKDEVLNAI